MPPETSVWGKDSHTFLSHILTDVDTYNDCDAAFVFGDFNASVGSMNDNSGFDDVNIPKRRVIDTTPNQHGHSFIEFLNESKMCMLYGRFDAENDNFTSISTQGKAEVNYMCVPHENVDQCESFKSYNNKFAFKNCKTEPFAC